MDNESSNLPESFWRRKASGPEREALRSRPELELEARLTDALAKVPDAPVASNFTARVMAEIEREEARANRPVWNWSWRHSLPRVAAVATVLFVAGISFRQYEVNSQRQTLARNVVMVAASHPAPSVDALEHLDAIVRMSQSSHADTELLADMQ
jgi:negative regulator of sigma E activity